MSEVEEKIQAKEARECAFSRIRNNRSRETQTILKENWNKGSSSEKERKVNALASGAEEGRD